jgi:hypothetical protein
MLHMIPSWTLIPSTTRILFTLNLIPAVSAVTKSEWICQSKLIKHNRVGKIVNWAILFYYILQGMYSHVNNVESDYCNVIA